MLFYNDFKSFKFKGESQRYTFYDSLRITIFVSVRIYSLPASLGLGSPVRFSGDRPSGYIKVGRVRGVGGTSRS